MLTVEIGLEDLERAIAHAWQEVPLRIEGERLLAKKFSADVALGPARCDTKQGTVTLPIEIVGAMGGALGRKIAKTAVFKAIKMASLAEIESDSEASTIVLDGQRLLRRLAPAFADYALTRLSFTTAGKRGTVVLKASATAT